MSDELPFGNLIFKYTREDALRDGVLIDITTWAHDSGLKLNTAINERLFHHYKEDTREHDIKALLLGFWAKIVTSIGNDEPFRDRIMTKVDGEDVVLHIGGGDKSEPVLTLCYLIDL
jgi:hypothetical protein